MDENVVGFGIFGFSISRALILLAEHMNYIISSQVDQLLLCLVNLVQPIIELVAYGFVLLFIPIYVNEIIKGNNLILIIISKQTHFY